MGSNMDKSETSGAGQVSGSTGDENFTAEEKISFVLDASGGGCTGKEDPDHERLRVRDHPLVSLLRAPVPTSACVH